MSDAASADPSHASTRAPAPGIHVALVEDDLLFQHTFVKVLAAASDMRLVAMAGTVHEGLAMLSGSPADVLLVDLGLPDGSGLDVIRQAIVQWPSCAVMVNTVFGDEAHVMQCIEAGASGYLIKASSPDSIVGEIRSVAHGGSPISPMIARQVLGRFRQLSTQASPASPRAVPLPTGHATEPAAALSAREAQVLDLVTRGFTLAEAARLMDISRHTVDAFVRRIYRKLNVSSKTEAIYEARRQGLLGD
ncbi:response regulator transcription factor [Ramlibacter sp. WS9]|uniref:response regulator transcription factor n=1 Tax=Ramlibacter sp. WS9 TaxID=1882741 RepID=UPI0011432BC8|nr:response regulator transcription factor [Ramlibacter sp. WS9]ROZ69013.1 DNA-binding response regulator [Ramlibacter sp. WS9]